jgi:hypothetical protein
VLSLAPHGAAERFNEIVLLRLPSPAFLATTEMLLDVRQIGLRERAGGVGNEQSVGNVVRERVAHE